MWLCVCCLASISCFFCFKQKTVYEMRIRYWSADVCSSDLLVVQQRHVAAVVDYQFRAGQRAVGKGEGHRVERQVPVFLKRLALPREQIGRASCRERVCQYVSIPVDAVSIKKNKHKTEIYRAD